MKLALTPAEHAELLEHAEVVDPPHRDVFVGPPLPTWYQPEQPAREDLERGLPPGAVGYSYQGPIAGAFSDVEMPTGVGLCVQDLVACSPSLKGKLAAAIAGKPGAEIEALAPKGKAT
jgi:hypothetical protein